MLTSRRSLLAAASLLPTLALRPAAAQGSDPRMADRVLGPADAKVTVQEFFSLTCTHCAAFMKETFPRVRAELIDTGKIRYVFRDFPLDQVALAAAMVARALPPERYEPFVSALLATQDRWAFARGVNPTEELAKMAALAGMPRATFDATIADDGLKTAILAAQEQGEKRYKVDSTPTFVMNDRASPGAIGFDAFRRAVEAAAAG
jgi:protein-disulfide isomerase